MRRKKKQMLPVLLPRTTRSTFATVARPKFFFLPRTRRSTVFPLLNTWKLDKKRAGGFPTRPSTHNLAVGRQRSSSSRFDGAVLDDLESRQWFAREGGKAFRLIRVGVRTRANNASKGGYSRGGYREIGGACDSQQWTQGCR